MEIFHLLIGLYDSYMSRVVQAGKGNLEISSKITIFGLKMGFFKAFSLFLNFLFQLAQPYI